MISPMQTSHTHLPARPGKIWNAGYYTATGVRLSHGGAGPDARGPCDM